MEKNVDKKNPLEELLKKHYVSGEQAFDYTGDAELEDYLDRLEQKQQEEEMELEIHLDRLEQKRQEEEMELETHLDRLEQKRQEEEEMIIPCIDS